MGLRQVAQGAPVPRLLLLLLPGLLAGCAAVSPVTLPPQPAEAKASGETATVEQATCSELPSPEVLSDPPTVVAIQPPGSPTLESASELSVEAVIQEVLARNPTLAQMSAAWRAAQARYPQVTSLDDPMLAGTIGPASIGAADVDFAYRIDLSQRVPFPGKLPLRGASALAEASAAGNDVEDTRLQLIESASDAFYEYYLVERALAVNGETLRRLKEFREVAEALYKTPPAGRKVSLQDVLQADVEIGRQQERQLTLERMRVVAVARINTLRHLPPDAPLPPAPRELSVVDELPDSAGLRTMALGRRPDLRALADRLAAEQAALALAYKEFCPDFDFMAAYDAFWQEAPLRPMVGVRLNLPVRTARRYGAIAEAEARIVQRRAELDRQTDQVGFQVQEAHAQVRESLGAVRLYKDKILPDAELNVKTARKDYETGQVPAVSVIEAERNRLALYDRYYEVVAGYFRRRAALERAVAGPLSSAMNPACATLP